MATPPLDEVERRIHERDTTLDLPGISLDLIAQVRTLDSRLAGIQNDLISCRSEVTDRDQRIERLQNAITRQTAIIGILRERMKVDLASHALAQASLDAFDKGAIIIP